MVLESSQRGLLPALLKDDTKRTFSNTSPILVASERSAKSLGCDISRFRANIIVSVECEDVEKKKKKTASMTTAPFLARKSWISTSKEKVGIKIRRDSFIRKRTVLPSMRNPSLSTKRLGNATRKRGRLSCAKRQTHLAYRSTFYRTIETETLLITQSPLGDEINLYSIHSPPIT